MVTEWIVPSAAAMTASRPISAPVGTSKVPPAARASSIRSGCESKAPTDSTIACFLAFRNGVTICGSNAPGAHSTTTSAFGSRSAIASTAAFTGRVSTNSRARSRFLAETADSVTPGMLPAASVLASDLPMAPRPAMAMRKGLGLAAVVVAVAVAVAVTVLVVILITR